MKRFKTTMLLATIATGALATAAQAQVAIPAPASNNGEAVLHGTGATSIQNLLVQELNCTAGNNRLGNANGTFSTIAEPTVMTDSTVNCAPQQIQPNFAAKYVGTGSGFGTKL